ncbi:MAG: polyphosphate kinase 2 family protein [Acetobacteraceae bacterium]|nr:polyphosphate kinase 2 family protein [Acetobacteraceae bacterium]
MNSKQIRRLLARTRLEDGKGFRLRDHDPGDIAAKVVRESEAEALLAGGVERLAALQTQLYAQSTWSLLCVFQAMDAAGKDGTISHVMSGVNPQGVHVHSFKAPSSDELAHDFLWRVSRELPRAGHIGIFNRSHYEEVLITRVHPDLLAHQNLPDTLRKKKHFWRDRLADIAAWEGYLARQGTVVLKFFLNISRAEQKKRFLERIDTPAKHWKFRPEDVAERAHWDEYMAAYEAAIAATATPAAPWFIVPADSKWFARLVVVSAMIDALERMALEPPTTTADDAARMAEARRLLEAEKP